MKDSKFRKYRTYVKIDLNAICENGRIARTVFPQQKILSVLKADAYGHGIAGVLPAYEKFSDWYAVATIEEAMLVREGSSKPILLFGPVPDEKMLLAARNDITFTIGSVDYAYRLSKIMCDAGIQAQCHLKIDSGLNRSGISWREDGGTFDDIVRIHNMEGITVVGTYTHLSCGEGQLDWEVSHTKLQMLRFRQACSAIEGAGLPLGIRHCCSTGGALVNPQYRYDMVRLGMMPMGMSFTDESVRELGLTPALTWISFVAQIKHVSAGEPISYGCTYYAEKPMKIGIVTCGYADGYRRAYSNKSHVLVGGKKVPVVGRIAMDYTMIDLTEIDDAAIGMEVIMLGSDGTHMVSAQELSRYGESVSGEVTCAISNRVPRIYTDKSGDVSYV